MSQRSVVAPAAANDADAGGQPAATDQDASRAPPSLSSTTTSSASARDAAAVNAAQQRPLMATEHAASGYDSDEEVIGRHKRAKVSAAKARALPEQYRQYFAQSWLEIRRNKCHYCIGCSSVFLVVFVVAVALSILNYSAILFLGLAEAQAGQIDLLVLPSTSYFSPAYINYTAVAALVASNGTSGMAYNTYRDLLAGTSYRASSCVGAWNASNPSGSMDWSYYQTGNVSAPGCSYELSPCLNYNCQPGTASTLMLWNSDLEKAMGLGRSWPYGPVPRGSCYITANTARTLRLSVGDTLIFSVYLPSYLYYFTNKAGFDDTQAGGGMVNIPLTVAEVLSSNYGKWGSDTTSYVLMEADALWPLVNSSLPSNYNATIKSALISQNLGDATSEMMFNLPPERFDYYQSSSFNVNAELVVKWASDVVYLLGANQVYVTVAVLEQLYSIRSASSFLGLALNMIILLLVGISILLIYSLFVISVESRTFELGIFRMIGLTRSGLVQMLMVHAMAFALPSWTLGLIFGQIAFAVIAKLLTNLTDILVSPWLSATSILIATALGLIIPIIAAIFPIRNALNKTVNDSINVQRSKAKAVVVTVERSSAQRYSLPTLAIGLLLTVAGIVIYYGLPAALVANNTTLLFNIFLFLLAGMMIGLVLLALNVQPLLESFLVWLVFLLFFFEGRAMPAIIWKNLQAHRMRNRKTAITYATALGFIIFLSVSVQLQIDTSAYNTMQSYGTTVSVIASNSDPVESMGIIPTAALEQWAESQPDVVDFAWSTFSMSIASLEPISVTIQNRGGYAVLSTNLYGVSPNIFQVLDTDLLQVGLQNTSSTWTIGQQLYGPGGGLTGFITGDYYQTALGLTSLNDTCVVQVAQSTSQLSIYRRSVVNPVALIRSAARFSLTYFPVTTQDTLVSFPHYLDLMNGQYNSVSEIPRRWMFVQLTPGLTQAEVDALLETLPTVVQGTVVNTFDMSSGLLSQQTTISIIFEVVTVFTMMVAFFSLNTSMYTNIMEQSKEIGILRALGVTRFRIYRIYTYEAFFLIASSAILGICIGILVGWSVSAQQAVFTEVPLSFAFPTALVITIFAVSLVCSFLATYAPIRALMRRSIVDIMRL